jgi:hypothetical protein
MAIADELVSILRDSATAGLEALADFLAEEVRQEAPGSDLKANIGWFRDELAAIVGPVNEPLAPWWRIAELGGWIRAQNWTPYIHSFGTTAGPFLWIPVKGGGADVPGHPFIPTVKLFRRGASSGAAIAYDPASKTLGGVVAALTPQVYHKPHQGTGYLNWVIEQKMAEGVGRFNAAMQASIDGSE